MNAYIYDHVRSPRGKRKGGALMELSPSMLATAVLKGLQQKSNLDTSKVEDVILGCVMQTGEQGGNIAKTVAQQAGYGDRVSGVTLNRFCASGLEAVNHAAAYINAGYADLLVAGGVESMSRVEMGADGMAVAIQPRLAMDNYFIPQGISADVIATKYGYSRKDLDTFAVESHRRAGVAQKEDRFKNSLLPIKDVVGNVICTKDEHARPLTTLEDLAKLPTSFDMMAEMGGFNAVVYDKYPEVEKINHVHHPGNSSGIVDGAGAMLIGNKEIGVAIGLKPRAVIKAVAIYSTDPTIMLEGPVPVTRLVLKKAGMKVSDIDLFEVNEAFAVVPLRFMEQLNVSHDQLNVNGGAIALGHPLGATGCMIVGTLLDELERRNKQVGLATLCIGGGMGVATIIERV
ncbi:MAG: acetyl-CoA C-acetyltransferase [Phycisphaerales bacterium]|nr:acetyl-CoA C-acetyltransferase [Phycisphaerales bacterium]